MLKKNNVSHAANSRALGFGGMNPISLIRVKVAGVLGC